MDVINNLRSLYTPCLKHDINARYVRRHIAYITVKHRIQSLKCIGNVVYLKPTRIGLTVRACLLRDKIHFLEVMPDVPALPSPQPSAVQSRIFIASCNGAISAGHRLTDVRPRRQDHVTGRSVTALLSAAWVGVADDARHGDV